MIRVQNDLSVYPLAFRKPRFSAQVKLTEKEAEAIPQEKLTTIVKFPIYLSGTITTLSLFDKLSDKNPLKPLFSLLKERLEDLTAKVRNITPARILLDQLTPEESAAIEPFMEKVSQGHNEEEREIMLQAIRGMPEDEGLSLLETLHRPIITAMESVEALGISWKLMADRVLGTSFCKEFDFARKSEADFKASCRKRLEEIRQMKK